MAITAQFLRNIMAEARPIIERQMNDAKIIAGLRTVVANNGGDWGALKALIKAHVEDEADDAGDGKRVKKIVDKADDTAAYADMLGLANMNEKNFSDASQSYAEHSMSMYLRKEDMPSLDPETGEITEHEQPETAHQFPAPTHKAAGHAPRNEGSEGANTEQDDVDGSAERAGHAGQPVDALAGQVETRNSDNFVERNTSGPDAKRAPHSNPQPTSSPDADKTGEVVPPPASPVELCDADVPAFLKKGKTDKPDCLKLKDGHCKIGFAAPALCSTCNQARMARAGA